MHDDTGTTMSRHNHQPRPYGALTTPGACPQCDQIRESRAAEGITDHNHERLPFGRRVPLGDCPRCDELHHGAKPRESNVARRARLDAERAADIREHFHDHENTCLYLGPRGTGVCVYGEW